jgi:hypothetical protein
MSKFSHMSHGSGEHATGHAGKTIARDGAPKKVTPVMHHPAMTRQQTDVAGLGGLGHPTATIDGGQTVATSAAASPLAHAYGGTLKPHIGQPVAQVPGQKSQTNMDCETHADKQQHGADMLDCAVKN